MQDTIPRLKSRDASVSLGRNAGVREPPPASAGRYPSQDPGPRCRRLQPDSTARSVRLIPPLEQRWDNQPEMFREMPEIDGSYEISVANSAPGVGGVA